MKDLKNILFKLSITDGIGNITQAYSLAFDMLSEVCNSEKTDNLTVIGFLKGKDDYTLMLDAHIDQIGMIVTDIDDEGFLTVKNLGAVDIRSLPSRRVTVHAKQKITAVFCSTPPHLASGEKVYDSITDIKLDTALGEKARDIISVGDYVTFANTPKQLLGNRVCGRSFDDRIGVACLITVAKMLKDKPLPFNVAFVLSDGEELGLRGIRTASYEINPQEAIAVDVSFGDAVGISAEDCSPLGSGAMIGLAPTLDREMSNKLISVAKNKNIAYTLEVMGAKTGTNADMISINREGVRTGLVSVPLRNMHSDVEIADLKDLKSTCELLCEYILSGGVRNA